MYRSMMAKLILPIIFENGFFGLGIELLMGYEIRQGLESLSPR